VGDILTYTWDFGDEGSALLPGPTHTYSVLGYYTVTLTVQDAYGSHSLVRPRYIHVTDVTYELYLPLALRSYDSHTTFGQAADKGQGFVDAVLLDGE